MGDSSQSWPHWGKQISQGHLFVTWGPDSTEHRRKVEADGHVRGGNITVGETCIRREKGECRERNICRDKKGHRTRPRTTQASPLRSAELMQCCCSETFIYLQPVVIAFAAQSIQTSGFLASVFFFLLLELATKTTEINPCSRLVVLSEHLSCMWLYRKVRLQMEKARDGPKLQMLRNTISRENISSEPTTTQCPRHTSKREWRKAISSSSLLEKSTEGKNTPLVT